VAGRWRKIVACCSTRYVAFPPLHAAKTPYPEWSRTPKFVIAGLWLLDPVGAVREPLNAAGCLAAFSQGSEINRRDWAAWLAVQY